MMFSNKSNTWRYTVGHYYRPLMVCMASVWQSDQCVASWWQVRCFRSFVQLSKRKKIKWGFQIKAIHGGILWGIIIDLWWFLTASQCVAVWWQVRCFRSFVQLSKRKKIKWGFQIKTIHGDILWGIIIDLWWFLTASQCVAVWWQVRCFRSFVQLSKRKTNQMRFSNKNNTWRYIVGHYYRPLMVSNSQSVCGCLMTGKMF